jgi:hypothetical protein
MKLKQQAKKKSHTPVLYGVEGSNESADLWCTRIKDKYVCVEVEVEGWKETN